MSVSSVEAKPEYVPTDFYNRICCNVRMISDHLSHLERNNESKKSNAVNIIICEKKKLYLIRMISNHLRLKDFYIQNQQNDSLLLHIMCAFEYLPEWEQDYKTTGREDAQIIQKMQKSLSRCASLLSESPDARFNIQMFWEEYIKKIIANGSHESVTDEGKKHLSIARKLIFPNLNSTQELHELGAITEDCRISRGIHMDLVNFFQEMSKYLEDIQPLAKDKGGLVKKINAQDAYIHYIVRRLKRILEDHNISVRKHVVNPHIRVHVKSESAARVAA